ncbi:MAG TPA: hypothetical protein VI790_00475 [Candidatus Nanoarchaeia archaeon]|nr:hypothetical protein [Candidatus Nanoarchaeia archaeon]
MLRKAAFLGLLSLLVIAGCTQQEGEVELTCDDYCTSQPHIQCIGSWAISGEYPDCACAWNCADGGSDVITPGDCMPDWSCTDWSECVINSQSRTCIDLDNCNITTSKPDVTQSCVVSNPCDDISDGAIKSECNVMFLKDNNYCEDDSFEECTLDLAKLTLNSSLCGQINNSFIRNSCRAIINNDKTYCDILEPSSRSLCYASIDNYLSVRGSVEDDSYYCGLISNPSLANNCMQSANRSSYYNHLANYSICDRFGFDYNSTAYQEIFACYVYHAKTDVLSPCSGINNTLNLTEVLFDECNALRDNRFSYCFDLNTTKRDKCFAHFSYLRNDASICKDAADNNECLNIVGRYLGKPQFCNGIVNESLRNSCIYYSSTQCISYHWKTCDINNCKLITNNDGLKDVCIYNIVKRETESEFVFKNFI